jgi:seryl-tRNA synthetase
MLNEELNKLKDTIRNRNEDLTSDWTPFVQNIEDMLDHITELSGKLDEINNNLGEAVGMIKNLRKILIKLEVIDDRFIF